MEKELHLYAGKLLDEGKVKEAWQVLLALAWKQINYLYIHERYKTSTLFIPIKIIAIGKEGGNLLMGYHSPWAPPLPPGISG